MVDRKQSLSSRNLFGILAFLGILISLLMPVGAFALFEAGAHLSDAKLITSIEGVGNQKTIWIGLDIHLKPDWKTYWRSPGASGYGIKIDWSKSKNLESTKFYWPVPIKFETFKMIANGYKDHVLFPIQVSLKKQQEPLILNAKLDYLVCDPGNCIPQSKIVTLTIPNKPNTPSIYLKDITRALKNLPETANPFLSIKSAQFIQKENAANTLRLTINHQLPLVSPDIFIEGKKHLFYDKISSLSTEYKANGATSVIELPIYKNEKKEILHTPNLIGQTLTITLHSGETTIEQKVPVVAPPMSTEAIFIIYGFALLGGFILNFMPCVLPVILLKIFSLTQYGGEKAASVRKALFFSVMGIISSFIFLALVPIFFSLFGISFGWGMQFQEPLFLVFMMLILTLFSANFWGFYEIILPEKVALLGYQYGEREGSLGHFLSGMFATLLATPCSAPYLGTAVTFALSRGPLDILFIFFFLGLGLSLPFIFVMIFPKVASYLPKPGKWMMTFKHILGWGFFFTMLWLFYVLTSQASYFNSLFSLAIMLSIIFLFWANNKFFTSYSTKSKLCIAAIMLIIPLPFISLAISSIKEGLIAYQPVELEKTIKSIKSNVKQGKIVFVDVTADWCLTCKANEFLVLDTNRTKNLLKKNDVVVLKIDWTSKSPEVYEYLRSFNRNGIPFYAVYGPHVPYGQPLPQLLTYSIIERALQKAK